MTPKMNRWMSGRWINMRPPPSKLQLACLAQISPEGSSTIEIANRLNRAHHEALSALRGLARRKMVKRGTVTLRWFVGDGLLSKRPPVPVDLIPEGSVTVSRRERVFSETNGISPSKGDSV